MQCVLAVDGGNTKTIALVAALDGTILGAGRAGCGDIYNARRDGLDSAAAAIANIEDAVVQALQTANVQASNLMTGVFNMAGADWPEDFALLHSAMQARGFGQTILVQNDALGVLHAGSADNTGVSIVCGTGGATGARAPDGRIWHSSMWQEQAQGGAQLGQKTLNAVYRAELGMELPTTLTQRVLDFFHLHTVEELLHLFTGRVKTAPRHHIRHLAPILLDEAHAGDRVARQIVQEHGWVLGQYALVAARKVGIEGTPFTLVLGGGVFRHPSTVLADAIVESVRTTSPDVQPTRYRFEPIIGVLFSALELARITIDDVLLEKLIPTIPVATLFMTVRDWCEQQDEGI